MRRRALLAAWLASLVGCSDVRDTLMFPARAAALERRDACAEKCQPTADPCGQRLCQCGCDREEGLPPEGAGYCAIYEICLARQADRRQ